MLDNQLLKLEKALNFRDIGGYRVAEGKQFKRNYIYRSDSLANLTDGDIESIRERGIGVVIDLRSEYELETAKSRLKDVEGIEYIHIQLLDNINSANDFTKMPNSLSELYVGLIENSADGIVQVFNTIIDNKEVGIVFNCTAGKDRTGVIAALILGVLGVSHDEIVLNYSVTAELMAPIFKNMMEQMKGMSIEMDDEMKKKGENLLGSNPEEMEITLRHIYDKYETVEKYLLQAGLIQEKIDAFKEMYTELVEEIA